MLTITSVSDASGRYLLEDPALEVADLFGGATRSAWRGLSAHRHGLVGAVTAPDLRVVLSGRVPGGSLQPGARQQRTSFDLVFAAPKPASVLMAQPDDRVARHVVLGHEAAVAEALGYIEDRAIGIVRSTSGSERSWSHVDGIVAAQFTHGVSRSGDPHLHSHVLLVNRARGADGRFGALDSRALRAHAVAADAIYRSGLRSELSRRLAITHLRTVDGTIRIDGVSDADCIAMSGRSEERRRGEHGRPAKVLRRRWEAMELWEERRRFAPSMEDAPRFARPADRLDEHRAAALLHDRPLVARTVVASVADAATAGISVDAIATVVARPGVLLGGGLAERPLPRSVIPRPEELALLGPRPVDRGRLLGWLDEAERIRERSRDRGISARGR